MFCACKDINDVRKNTYGFDMDICVNAGIFNDNLLKMHLLVLSRNKDQIIIIRFIHEVVSRLIALKNNDGQDQSIRS